MVDHRLQDEGVPASLVDEVVRVVPGRGDGDVGPADDPGTLRVAAVLEGSDGVVQPVSTWQRHVARVEPLHNGRGDLTHDDAHGGDAHAEQVGDGAVLPGPGVPPQGDGQSAARLDGDPVVGSPTFD